HGALRDVRSFPTRRSSDLYRRSAGPRAAAPGLAAASGTLSDAQHTHLQEWLQPRQGTPSAISGIRTIHCAHADRSRRLPRTAARRATAFTPYPGRLSPRPRQGAGLVQAARHRRLGLADVAAVAPTAGRAARPGAVRAQPG